MRAGADLVTALRVHELQHNKQVSNGAGLDILGPKSRGSVLHLHADGRCNLLVGWWGRDIESAGPVVRQLLSKPSLANVNAVGKRTATCKNVV